ncbi:LicD family protein [Herbivorax sp. ANBcel31]|uniref:LicD family protein n=1 Tax=Herbivorax sp. ANBcel31 TaxID=3069754 RepID=UPI0027B6FE10|nr:LicD family protein [Herbivorax sp. ANBcel31]MDQ2085663.1 LicD family protein [Herbivorax sp. ANBcel31]
MNIDIKKTQSKILEIVKYLDAFCNEYNIKYYLEGGSALGAIRHNGFVPWDDDFDIIMTYEDYYKFIDICKKHLDKERFYLQKEDTKEWPMFHTKLRMNNTTYIERDTENRKMHKGVYIDIFCLNNVSDNRICRYFQYLASRILISRALYDRGYNTSSFLKKIVIHTSSVFVRGIVRKKLINVVRGLNGTDTAFVAHLFGRDSYNSAIFPSNFFGKPRCVKFSNLVLPVPQKVENYLEVRFGSDYMKVPDAKVQEEYQGHAVLVDVDKDYREFEKEYQV